MILLCGAMGVACQEPPPDGDGGQSEPPAPSGSPGITIISPILDRSIPSGSTITITYSVTNSPTDVIAFIDEDTDSTNQNEVVFAQNLSGGSNRTVNFATEGIVPGVYHFGIRATNASGTNIRYATTSGGQFVTIAVNGRPQPAINSPVNDLEVLFGTTSTVAIAFSCNDPENAVSWEVFFDTNQVLDGTEVTIGEPGTGNSDPFDPAASNVTVNWLTLGVPEGNYSIGLICTDTAGSQAFVYADGQVTITSELSIPGITVTEPANDLVAFPDDSIKIEFAASNTAVPGATITLFLDLAKDGFDGSELRIASELSLGATSREVAASLIADGVYFIGAVVEQGSRRSDASYAPGKLTITGVGDLVVSQPADPVTVTPGTNVTIAWSTNLPTGRGLIDLALFNSDVSGNPGAAADPDPLAALKDLEIRPSTKQLDTSTLTSGFYVVEVTLTLTDASGVPTGDPPSVALSEPIRVTTLPTVLWVGSIELSEDQQLDPPLGHFDGVVFEGINFEDNAGSSLLAIPQAQGFPLGGAFMIGAVFAKPLFANPSGIGAGEAYLIYNDIGEINRRYSLNAVGSRVSLDDDPNALAGLRFAGLAFDQTPEDINGDGQIKIDSEDVDGDGLLDRFNEDVDFDGLVTDGDGSTIEDIDLDGFADLAEDGFVGVDGNTPGSSDGRIDNASERFFFDQFVNGALDISVSEDRDGDGQLDAVGDATWGLSSMALLPDVDGDGIPELAFGFEYTDSLSADFRRLVLGETEPPNFGDLTQENQFERGGLVMIPSTDEGTLLNPFQLGRGEDRVIQLDFVGQGFDPSPEDAGDDDDDQNTTGVVPPDSEFQDGRPFNGQDVFPYVRDRFGETTNPDFCEAGDIQLEFINNLSVAYPARARFIRTRFPAGGGAVQEDIVLLTATPGGFARLCLDVGDETVRLTPTAVELLDPDISTDPPPVGGADISGMTVFGPTAFGNPVYGVSGSLFDATARSADFEFAVESFFFDTCAPSGSDNCLETMVGPFYGFDYAAVAVMESPTHPLAYRRTLANPARRAEEFSFLNSACADKCGRVLPDVTTILEAGAPAYGDISTGFCPGVANAPVGARILGQRVGDRFGASISRNLGSDNRVFVGAPQRPGAGGSDAGAVYQFKMESFWSSGNDLAGLNDFDVPKPHQYIIKEGGSRRPDGLVGPQRGSMNDAIVYSGADAGDRLGEAVVGILDFNGDAKPDILMGAPGADGRGDASADSGAVYVIYRLPTDIEASVSLDKIELDPANVNRLNGLLINGDSGDRLGTILAGNCDLNGDGSDDIVIGNPLNGGSDSGEVVILFGGPNLASPAGGSSIQELVDLDRAVRIKGVFGGDQTGFSVVCNGDFDGDGQDDLAFSAPFATPRFDSDGDDILDAPGLDLNRDGQPDLDDNGLPLIADPGGAGLIYVITNADNLSGTLVLSQMGAALQGFIIAGRKGDDNMGGGFDSKRSTRSQGLAYAGDVNGDGKSDLLVSSILADPLILGSVAAKTNAGEVYLIHGFTAQEAAGFLTGD